MGASGNVAWVAEIDARDQGRRCTRLFVKLVTRNSSMSDPEGVAGGSVRCRRSRNRCGRPSAAIRAAAEGASVGLFEKADTVGGTSAWSGGMVWIPVNPHMAELGIEDSREEVLTYLESLSNGLIDMDLAATLIDAGPEVVTWLEENTPVRFRIIKDFPDYQPEHPGAKPGRGPVAGMPPLPVRRARQLARAGHGGAAAFRQHQDERDDPWAEAPRRAWIPRSLSGARSATSEGPGRG